MTKRAFGELEAEILHFLRTGERKTVKEVHAALGGSYNTVMTVMSRLAAKKQLEREKTGLQYTYWLGSNSPTFLIKLKKFFGIKPSVLLSHLIESELSDEELEEMEKMVQKVKRDRDRSKRACCDP